MKRFDVFNGDADGICALVQLRLAQPAASTLVTGAKRDIALLARVDAGAGDQVTVLDVSADANHDALVALLARGAEVDYFDHHYAGRLPAHPRLRAHIDVSARTCTSLIVDRHLRGGQRVWAIVGAFGDNLPGPARASAASLALGEDEIRQLRELGELVSYNAYGDDEADLVIPPAELYRALHRAGDPLAFLRRSAECQRLAAQRRADMDMAAPVGPHASLSNGVVYLLPDAAWSRRVRAVLANDLAIRFPDRAHAVLSPDRTAGYVVSVRAPVARPAGADTLCRRFPGGGGRVAAAGINHLPRDALPAFVAEMDRVFASSAASPSSIADQETP